MTMPGAGGRSPAARATVVVMVMAVVAAQLLLLAAATPEAAQAQNNVHAMMSPGPAVVLTVDQTPGNGHYTSVQAAINAAPANGGALIKISPGTYREKVVVNKTGLSLVGIGPDASSTIITWNGPWSETTQYEFPFFLQGDASDFVATRITFQNTWGKSHQAVAARVDGDRAAFYDCRFLSYQDTLFDVAGRHYYNGCYIEGATDFIYGNGKAFFESCHLHSISDDQGAFTAQGREALSQDTGFSFVRCDLTGTPGKSILGRPWRPYARVVFALCNMSDTVAPVGWDDWNDTKDHSTAYFGQYQCYGAGFQMATGTEYPRARG